MKNKRGISSLFIAIYVAVLAVIILSTLFIGLSISQSSVASYSKIEQERTQENILIRGPHALNVTSGGNVESLWVNNTGGITVRIRSLYIGGTLVCDPSTFPGDSYIPPQSSLCMNLSALNINIYNNTILEANWAVTTERGTKSSETGANLWLGSTVLPDEANKFYFGPLLLRFDMFHWSNDGGVTWNPGWAIPEAPGDVIWQILAADIDERPVILNASSSFALIQNSQQSQKIATWNIGPSDLNPDYMPPGFYYFLHFSLAGPNSLQDVASPNPVTMNFITIIGSFIEQDGSLNGFAQTIPFEAVKISVTPEIPTYATLSAIPSPQTVRQPATVSGQVTVNAGAQTVPQNSIVMIQYCAVGSGDWENILVPIIRTGSGGSFSGSFSPPHAGTYEYRAMFMGATKGKDVWAYSSSASQIITVNKATSTTTMQPLSPITIGQSTSATATVNPSFATGTVTFEVSTDNGATYNFFCTKPIASGSAVSDSYTPSAPGNNYRFRAAYNGDADVLGSPVSTPVTLTVNKATPTLTTPTLNPASPITLNDSVTATVTITGVPGITPTGAITFRVSTDGGLTWNIILSTHDPVSGSVTSNQYTPSYGGNQYRIRADYSGDTNYNPANSAVAPLTVRDYPSITAPTFAPASPVPFGTSVTINVTVSGTYGTPTGNVTFEVSTDDWVTFTDVGTATLAGGIATYPYLAPAIGDDYQFRAVYAGDNNYLGIQSNSSTSLTVKYAITASAGPNGSIDPPGIIFVDPGSSQTFTITPDAHYHFETLTIDSSPVTTTSSYTFTNIDASHSIYATFAIDTNTIVASAGANGAINPSGNVIVNYGDSPTFTITPSLHYHVDNVLVDGSPVGAVTSYTFTDVIGPHTIAASFTIDTYTITVTTGSNGAITPGTQTVDYGAMPSFSITPATGYHILDVKVDGASFGPITSYTFNPVTADHTLEAIFEIDTYTITATAGSGGALIPSGGVTVNYGSHQTFTIAPDTGYNIGDVTVDGSSVGAVTSYTFLSVTANHTISATFVTT